MKAKLLAKFMQINIKNIKVETRQQQKQNKSKYVAPLILQDDLGHIWEYIIIDEQRHVKWNINVFSKSELRE